MENSARDLVREGPPVKSGKRPRAKPSARAAQVLSYLCGLRARSKGAVVPSVRSIGEAIGVTGRTVRRALTELRARGLVVGVYNGGRGRRTIYYAGPAAARIVGDLPRWEHSHQRAGKTILTFGGLRLGRTALKRQGKQDKSAILTAPISSHGEGSSDRQAATPPVSEALPASMPPGKREPPPRPPPRGGDPREGNRKRRPPKPRASAG